MSAQHWTNPLTLRRGFISVLALGAASLLIVASASAQDILRNVRGKMELSLSQTQSDWPEAANRLNLLLDERALQAGLVRADRIFPIAGVLSENHIRTY
jgi:hypothetical protein